MNTVTRFLKNLHLGKVLSACLMVAVLFVTTACNSGNAVGARPLNPPVQMGGANNPHKGGGDGYSEYKATTDPAAIKRSGKQASLQLPGNQLIATGEIRSNASDLLYPNSNATDTKNPLIGPVGSEGRDKLQNPQQIPAIRQPVIDRSDPDAKILEKTGQAFKDASGFLQDTADSAIQHPEMQVNPGVGK